MVVDIRKLNKMYIDLGKDVLTSKDGDVLTSKDGDVLTWGRFDRTPLGRSFW